MPRLCTVHMHMPRTCHAYATHMPRTCRPCLPALRVGVGHGRQLAVQRRAQSLQQLLCDLLQLRLAPLPALPALPALPRRPAARFRRHPQRKALCRQHHPPLG